MGNPTSRGGISHSIDIAKDTDFIAFTHIVLFIINVNVLFLSNSQPPPENLLMTDSCL